MSVFLGSADVCTARTYWNLIHVNCAEKELSIVKVFHFYSVHSSLTFPFFHFTLKEEILIGFTIKIGRRNDSIWFIPTFDTLPSTVIIWVNIWKNFIVTFVTKIWLTMIDSMPYFWLLFQGAFLINTWSSISISVDDLNLWKVVIHSITFLFVKKDELCLFSDLLLVLGNFFFVFDDKIFFLSFYFFYDSPQLSFFFIIFFFLDLTSLS